MVESAPIISETLVFPLTRDLQGIVEKMRVNVGLQRHDPRFPQRNLLTIYFVKLLLQVLGHFIKRMGQVRKFPVRRKGLKLITQIAFFDIPGTLT